VTHPKLATARSGYGGRGYYIPGRMMDDPVSGKETRLIVPSVTTALKQVNKPGLMQWIADQTAAYAVVNLPYLQTRSEEVGWRYLRFYWSRDPNIVGSELRLHHEGVRDDAADMGTNIHEWIEAQIDGLVEAPAFDSVEAEQMAEAFERWMTVHQVTSYASEYTVFNSKLGYAGTADARWGIVCLHDHPCLGQAVGEEVITLIDLKSSRNTWNEHGFQLAALAAADVAMVEVGEDYPSAQKHEATQDGVKQKSWWIEESAPAYDRYALLHIRPDDLDPQGDRISRFCILEDRTADLDLYTRGFSAALELAKVEYELKARAKSRMNETEGF
jgi:hypothetical protein